MRSFHKLFRKLNCPAVAQFSKQALELCHTGKETKTKRSCAPFTHQSLFTGHVEYNNIWRTFYKAFCGFRGSCIKSAGAEVREWKNNPGVCGVRPTWGYRWPIDDISGFAALILNCDDESAHWWSAPLHKESAHLERNKTNCGSWWRSFSKKFSIKSLEKHLIHKFLVY